MCIGMCKLFLQVSGIDGLAVAVKIDKNSLIPSKWAAVARCQVCNGILQRSAVPTGARVHPNPITYPDSTHFPITGGGKAIHTTNWLLSLWDIQRVWLVEGGSDIRGGESEAVHGWAKGMKPEVCFVVGLVSFSGTAGVRKTERQGHGGQAFQYFSIFT